MAMQQTVHGREAVKSCSEIRERFKSFSRRSCTGPQKRIPRTRSIASRLSTWEAAMMVLSWGTNMYLIKETGLAEGLRPEENPAEVNHQEGVDSAHDGLRLSQCLSQ